MPFRRPAAVLVAVSLGLVVAAACGSDDSGTAANGTGAGGTSSDASTESGATAGGSLGTGGVKASSGGAGTAGRREGGAGQNAADGGDADAGPSCPPPPTAPAADVTIGSTCTAPAACGGTLTGTWMLESLCASKLFTVVRGLCSSAQIDLDTNETRGGVAFDGTTATMSIHGKASASVTFPNNCSFCRCADLESQLASAGLASASCNPTCSSAGSCTCTVNSYIDLEGTHPYSVSANTLTTDPNLAFDYCVASAKLTLADASSRSGFDYATFIHQKPPPEICDGFDNDLDGVTDEDPVECPTCSNVGVCAEGFTATCGGSSGWRCTYTSPKYEDTEQSCDKLDNDCNGIVDKLPTCEICDGVDNDTNGSVDDNLTDTPTCGKTGVCASGTTATCAGKDGWHCQGTAPTYELVETKCDGLDNDCDGAVDEACPACTGTKDMWVAGSTGVLDMYRGVPTATTGQKILSTDGRPTVLTADPSASKLYWVNNGITPIAVQRANFDGTGLETLAATAVSGPSAGIGGIAVDPGKTLFWFENGKGIVRTPLTSINTPGSDQAIVTGVAASKLAVAAGRLYYNDTLSSSLHRCDLDGKNDEVVVPFPADQFVVDLIDNHIYWFRWFDFAALMIWSTNLDGSGQKLVADGSQFTSDFYLSDFAVDPWRDLIFITSSGFIQKLTIGGTARAELVQWTPSPSALVLAGCAP